MRAASETKEKARAAGLRRKCKELIARAEILKRSLSTANPRVDTIIQGASRLHGNDFPPWDSEPRKDEFSVESGAQTYRYPSTSWHSKAYTKISQGMMLHSHFLWPKKQF
jgi:hypothetical protein